MAAETDDQKGRDISVADARQGQPRGFVRYVMFTSIALALIGMFIAYLVILR
ncbi:MAG: hypothetical protein ACT443_11350 [Gemmatimonadota bacterium]